jgi:alcohol dehydrogenase
MAFMRNTWGYSICGELIFGKHALEKLGKIAKRLGGKDIFIITDPTIHKIGHLEKAAASLDDNGLKYEVFDRGEPEPSIEKVLECTEIAKKAHYDIFVCLGGGSVIDLGKAVAALVRHGGHPQDYFGEGKIPGPVVPLIAIPTTAGTGSEISPSSVLTDVQANLKKGIADNKLRPTVSIVDPLLTLTCPPHVTAATGIDVLAHAIEAYMAIDFAYLPLQEGEEDTVLYHGSNPVTDCLAKPAIEMVAENLRIVVDQGQNVQARENMAMANVLASMGYTNAGVTAVHALAYPLGAVSHAPHGVVNGLLLPHVMQYNIPVRTDRVAEIAWLMGINTHGKSEREAAYSAVDAVRQLIDDIGLPSRMREIGVKEEDIRPMAEATMGITRLLRGNPRRVTADDLEEIFKRAF